MTSSSPDLNDFAAGVGVDPKAAAAGSAGSGATLTGSQRQVYMGTVAGPDTVERPLVTPQHPWPDPHIPGERSRPVTPDVPVSGPMPYERIDKPTMGVNAAKLDILNWTDAEREALAARLVAAGELHEGATLAELRAAWENMVEFAADHYQADPEKNKLTPYDMIDLYHGTDMATGQPNAPRVSTVVQKQATLTDPEQARAVLNQALSNAIGRQASDAEVDDFQVALNDAQRANPVVTTTTRGGTTEASTSSSVSTGGTDIGGFAEQYASHGDNAEEYKHYQAATTYMEALKGILGPTVG